MFTPPSDDKTSAAHSGTVDMKHSYKASHLQRPFSTLKVGPWLPWEPDSPCEAFPGRTK